MSSLEHEEEQCNNPAPKHQDYTPSDLASPPKQLTSSLLLNSQNVAQNSTAAVHWRFHKQQPSNADDSLIEATTPPTDSSSSSSTTLRPLDTTNHLRPDSPLSAGLRIHTNITSGLNLNAASASSLTASHTSPVSPRRLTKTNSIPISRSPSVKKALANSAGSAASSVISSPMLNAMQEVTPLPSPLLSSDSPGPWKKLISRPTSRDLNVPVTADSALVTANGESINSAILNAQKRRQYHGLMNTELNLTSQLREKNAEKHTRNRSISEYVPENLQVFKTRHITVSGSHVPPDFTTIDPESHMRREPHLAAQRGLAGANDPPTPPQEDGASHLPDVTKTAQASRFDYFEARTRPDNKKRRWRAIRILGEGTFSKVMLATSQLSEEDGREESSMRETAIKPDDNEMDHRKLVAIKICEHGPKGGASEERVEMSLKRELEMLKTVHHPSVVNLKAWAVEETRAILVLNYCAGGDLFDVASECIELLVPSLLQRIFSELVGAVRYLHECHIVHRDIKLENILVNLPKQDLAKPVDWNTYPYSVTTLTDLGLSRRIADDEKLTTRCGSDDYAAPEVILGQPYDGRLVDAWSLGVVYYALLESRLPFDPPPNAPAYIKQRSKSSHRICRIEWMWIKYNGDEGDNEADPAKFEKAGLLGAMRCTEALLKKARYRASLDKIAENEWIKDGISVEGGIRFREEHIPDEV